ncbi:MAG TPA: YajQ family cyclic di-GMP-binding protein [Actinomycetota bacterium]|nr:YajQ family cyclic di-GMP-binding protein [Actinomycetota bacterium]
MAQASFDVVSEVDQQEVMNAVDQTRREITQRFDFKNTGTEIKHESEHIEVRSSSEGRVQAAVEVLKEKMVRRNVSLKALSEGKIEPAGGSNFKQTIDIVHGISDEKARTINKFIKGLGHRVQSQVQGDQLRVSSKSRDDLQAVIAALKEEDFGIPLQFTNYR